MRYFHILVREVFHNLKDVKFITLATEGMILKPNFSPNFSLCQVNLTHDEAMAWLKEYAHQISPNPMGPRIACIHSPKTGRTARESALDVPSGDVREPPVL